VVRRLVRSVCLTARGKPYVEAAIALVPMPKVLVAIAALNAQHLAPLNRQGPYLCPAIA